MCLTINSPSFFFYNNEDDVHVQHTGRHTTVVEPEPAEAPRKTGLNLQVNKYIN